MAVVQQDKSKGPGDAATMNTAHGGPTAPKEDVWDEERLEKAMQTLKEMHIQLRGLRTSIPRLIAPLTTQQSSPEILFRDFSKSANTAMQEVKDFRQLMNDKDSIKVLEQANKSRRERPGGIKPWRATDDPDWLTRDR